MKVPVGVSALGLAAGECLRIESPKNWQLRARRGTVWITIDGDPRDFILEPGQSLTIERDAPALVSALHDAAVIEALRLPQPAKHSSAWHMVESAWRVVGVFVQSLGREVSRRLERAHRFLAGAA